MDMNREFPDSIKLAVLLKWYDWALYDVTTTLPSPYAPSLDEIAFDEATRYEVSHRYLLLPIPAERETLKQAYGSLRDQHVYPVLRIPASLSTEEKSFNIKAEDGSANHNFNIYYLNEFYFQENKLCTSSSIFFAPQYSSRVAIPTQHVLDAFSRYFCLVQFTDNKLVIKKPAQNYSSIN